MLRKFLLEDKYWILRHLLFWISLYLNEGLYIIGFFEEGEPRLLVFFEILLDMFLLYFNIYYLLPTLLLKSKVSLYLLLTGLSLLFVVSLNYFDTVYIAGEEIEYSFEFLYTSSLFTLSTLATGVAIKAAKYIYVNKNKEIAIQQLKKDAEIQLLKDQVNPHFLFNSLNSMYVLAKEKSDILPEQILLLSDLMRYQTYDSNNEKVPLKKEIAFLKNYLDLEKLRSNQLHITVIDTNIADQIKIEPLLFLPFVENACKYTKSTDNSAESIKIEWQIKDGHLEFLCVNSIGDNQSMQAKEYSGEGLKNINQRLQLLYPNAHELTMKQEGKIYLVKLKLKL